ncbi:glycerol-3-phosphate cytidylyltransferase, partial [Vibrio cholerae]
FPENSWEQKREDIIKYNAHLFAMGDDWIGKFDSLMDICDVVYLPRTEDISTTKIKKTLRNIHVAELDKIESSLHDIISVVKAISLRK